MLPPCVFFYIIRSNKKNTTTIDEQAVQDIISCLEEFKCDQFSYKNQTLCVLQSGLPASESLSIDL